MFLITLAHKTLHAHKIPLASKIPLPFHSPECEGPKLANCASSHETDSYHTKKGHKGFRRGAQRLPQGDFRRRVCALYIYPSLCAIILLRNVVNRGDKYITQIRAIKAPKASRNGFSRVCCELYLSFPSYLCATETKAHDDDEIMSIAIGLPASSYLTD